MKFKLGAALVVLLLILVGLDFSRPDLVYGAVQAGTRAAAGLKLEQIHIDDADYYYLDNHRANAPVLLQIHGFSGDKDNFARMDMYLGKYRLLAIDLLGHGQSSAPFAASYKISAQIARIHKFCAALGLDKVHIIGNSMGGHIAAMYAARYPDAVSSVILFDNSGVMTPVASELMSTYIETGENALLINKRADVDTMLNFVFDQPPFMTPNIKRAYADAAIAKAPLYTKIFNDFTIEGYEPLEDELGKIRVPVHIVWGEHDRVLHSSSIEVMRALIPKVSSTIMLDTGHVPMLERPWASARIVDRFISKL